jgi:hypothetical protein
MSNLITHSTVDLTGLRFLITWRFLRTKLSSVCRWFPVTLFDINHSQATHIVRNGIRWVVVSDNASTSKRMTKLNRLILLPRMDNAACRRCGVSATGATVCLPNTAFKMLVRPPTCTSRMFSLKLWSRYSIDQRGQSFHLYW